jgi:hypothetical protein
MLPGDLEIARERFARYLADETSGVGRNRFGPYAVP